MDNFSELIKEAIAGGDDLESAMRKAAAIAAKEAVESLLQTEVESLLGYAKYDPEGKNSGDSRNGSYERTIQTSVGPITVRVPRDRNGEYEPMALPKYQRRTDLVTSAILKLYSSGMTDEEMRLAIGSIYEANYSRSAISAITDAVVADVKKFSKRRLPRRFFALFLDSTYVPVRRDSVAKEAINIAMLRPSAPQHMLEGQGQGQGRGGRGLHGDSQAKGQGVGRIRDGGVRGEMEVQVPETQGMVGESGGRFDLLRFPGRPQEAGLHEQQDRVVQQADKKAGEEADPIRDRGGVGEANRVDVPALQRRPGQEESEMLEGNRCLLRGEVIRIRISYRESFTQDSGYSQ